MTKKNLVLFDVGAVLLELNYAGLYWAGAKAAGKTAEEFKNLSSNLEVGVLNGKVSFDEHQKRIRELLNSPDMTRQELEDFVKQAWGTEITPVVDLKERTYFKADCPVNIFSNIDRFAFEYLSKTYPRMMQTFRPDAVPICSYSSKGTKPHSLNMYNEGLKSAETLGCDNVILIDDKESVLKVGIEQFGWYGIHFTPHIDANEGIRLQSLPEKSFASNKLFVANSVQDLEKGLGEFGIKL